MKFLRFTLLSFALFIIGGSAHAQAPYFGYAGAFANPSTTNVAVSTSVAVDNAGNTYSAGYFSGTIDFDPGAGVSTLTVNGNQDIYVTKTDASGALVWARSFGGSGQDRGTGVAVDETGNVYLSGVFFGTVDFDPGTGTSNITAVPASGEGCIVKLDAGGNFVWANATSTSSGGICNAVTVDALGQVYIAGSFSGTGDFDPGAGTANLTSAGGADAFAWKLSSSGSYIWAKRWGGTGIDVGSSIAVDPSGNVIAAGTFLSTVDFDPGAGTANLATNGTGTGGSDIFINKLDAAGDYVWARRIGGNGSDNGRGVAVDAGGNVYITGGIQGPGNVAAPGVSLLAYPTTNGGSIDGVVVKFNAAGAFQWFRTLGGNAADISNGIAVDASGNVYTTGSFNGTADFDPGAGAANVTSAGSADIFVSKLDNAGTYIWAKGFGSTASDVGAGIAADGEGNVYTVGNFLGNVNFDPNGSAVLTSSGPGTASSAFLQKLSNCSSTSIASATSNNTLSTLPINGNILPLSFINACQDIARLLPTGPQATRVSGAVTATVYENATAAQYNSQYYARRTYDITAAANQETSTGTLTLYYTQADFDNYNATSPAYPLPTGPADAAGIGNIRVTEQHGTSATGAPGSYTTTTVPANVAMVPSVLWNSTIGRWEVTVPVTGFGGFFIYGSNNLIPLPVKLLSFNAYNAADAGNRIEWATGAEDGGTSFEVWRSIDAAAFKPLATIQGKGPGSAYSFYDGRPFAGTTYYRLKTTDAGGNIAYSHIAAVRREASLENGGIMVWPMPAAGTLTISCTDAALKGGTAIVFDMQGREVCAIVLGDTVTLDIKAWASGIYILKLPDNRILRIAKQ